MLQTLQTATHLKTLSFIKKHENWYADLPEFLEAGLGTKANLLMVDGSDTFLDFLSGCTDAVSVTLSTQIFNGHNAVLIKEGIGINQLLLNAVGHAPVSYGAYYNVTHFKGLPFSHRLWLCPVTEYVFGGTFPDKIFIEVIN